AHDAVDDGIAEPRDGGRDLRVDRRGRRRRADRRVERVPDVEADGAGVGSPERAGPGSEDPAAIEIAGTIHVESAGGSDARGLTAQPLAYATLGYAARRKVAIRCCRAAGFSISRRLHHRRLR